MNFVKKKIGLDLNPRSVVLSYCPFECGFGTVEGGTGWVEGRRRKESVLGTVGLGRPSSRT